MSKKRFFGNIRQKLNIGIALRRKQVIKFPREFGDRLIGIALKRKQVIKFLKEFGDI